jgi:hypothetical protein
MLKSVKFAFFSFFHPLILITVFLAFACLWSNSVSGQPATMCPGTPQWVPGLSGPPDFANAIEVDVAALELDQPVPIGFAQQIDDPRWNGAWRYDQDPGGGVMWGVRALVDKTPAPQTLYLSMQVRADPNGAQAGSNLDAAYIGFALNDGSKAEILKLTMTQNPPLRASNSHISVSCSHYDGTNWSPFLVCGYASAATIRAWSGEGTKAVAGSPAGTDPTYVEWAFHAKIDVALVGQSLTESQPIPVPPLSPPFRVYLGVDVSVGTAVVPLTWTGPTLEFSPFSLPLFTTPEISTWGQLALSGCTGISISALQIGTEPMTLGVPSSVVHWGYNNPNDNVFVANYSVNGITAPADGKVQAVFRIANWGSTIGSGSDWKQVGAGTVLPTNVGNKISLGCVNPPRTPIPPDKPVECPLLTGTNPSSDQCMLVELSAKEHGSTTVTFINDSVKRNMYFTQASDFSRDAEISVRGLTPLPGSTGKRDVYLYVKTTNMPTSLPAASQGVTYGDFEQAMAVEKRQKSACIEKGRRIDGGAAYSCAAVSKRSQRTVYEKLSGFFPTYEVYVYHATGRSRTVNGKQVPIVEPQIPFGYFVEHKGDLTGWGASIEGVGTTLEYLSPNWYRVKVPDNGSITVRTKVCTFERYLFGIVRCCCEIVRGGASSPTAILGTILIALFVGMRFRSRRLRRLTSRQTLNRTALSGAYNYKTRE